jgi:hypothetical protein
MFGCPEEGWKIGYMNLSLPAEGSGHFYWKSNFADVLFLDKNNTDIIGENDELHILGPYSSNNKHVINHLLVVLSNIFKQDEGTIQIHLYCNLDLLFTVVFFEIHSEPAKSIQE